jgi:hypothetical protein
MRRVRALYWPSAIRGLFVAASGTVAAHAGSIVAATTTPAVPIWFVVLTAGVVVGSSFLFTSLMADHETLELVNGLGLRGRLPSTLSGGLALVFRAVALLVVVGVIVVGALGPADPQRNAATLLVWVGWWGGFTMVTYLVGNAWPLVNPVRLLAAPIGDEGRLADSRAWGAWPAVVGLLLIVWLEVATAVSANPRLLAGLVVLYGVATVLGSALVGRRRFFETVDPIAAVFRVYGRLAPVQRTDDGLALRLPGAALTDEDATTAGVPAFVVALLWATTFDGMVSTPAFQTVAAPLIGAGVPAPVLYLVVLLAGFGLFYGVYRRACRSSRESADTYVTGRAIERWFAPSLIPIAAGYHLAHFLGYVVSLSVALVQALGSPLATTARSVTVVVLPDWFGLLQLTFVLVGHLLAIWVAHSIAFRLFPGVRQAIRSQYPMILVMIGYTMISAWVVVSPSTSVVLA